MRTHPSCGLLTGLWPRAPGTDGSWGPDPGTHGFSMCAQWLYGCHATVPLPSGCRWQLVWRTEHDQGPRGGSLGLLAAVRLLCDRAFEYCTVKLAFIPGVNPSSLEGVALLGCCLCWALAWRCAGLMH